MAGRAIPTIAVLIAVSLNSCTTGGGRYSASPATGGGTVPGATGSPRIGDHPRLGPPISIITAEPEIRVRLARGVSSASLSSPGHLTVAPTGPDAGRARERRASSSITIAREGGAYAVRGPTGRGIFWDLQYLRIDPARGSTITFNGQAYPGAIVLTATSPGQFDVINYVPLESYLPGVLDRELYQDWEMHAYAAQAIAARTYALWETSLNRGRDYDLESTTASQVYGGVVNNRKAIDAVRGTHGRVLVYDGRIVPAFYSSSNGGVAQDGPLAFPGRAPDIEPLRGGARGEWDRLSPAWRWGPITRDRAELARRLVAWGRAHTDPIANLNQVRQIEVTSQSSGGRPAIFTLTDQRGRRFRMPAESFRHAANADAPGLPPVPKEQQLRSSFVDVKVVGYAVMFSNGRGMGHGVGLSQWGAQALAKHGYTAGPILRYYYPGAEIKKIY